MKRTISILLAVIMLVSCAVISTSAYSWFDTDVKTVEQAVEEFRPDYEALYGKELKTNRYYFLMPNGSNGDKGDDPSLDTYGKFAPSWYNEMTDTAGIYWWDTKILDPTAWIGYIAMRGDAEDVFYADVPTFVTGFDWNNGVDGGLDSTAPQYTKAAQSADIGAEYYDPGESANYPNGTTSFDGMIYIIDPDKVSISDYSQQLTCGGEWYYYYGEGHYGFVEGGESDLDANCLRDDHDHGREEPPIPEFKVGDADLDGSVSVMDATKIQRAQALLETLTEMQATYADADADGTVSVMDATEIQLFCAQLIASLPR